MQAKINGEHLVLIQPGAIFPCVVVEHTNGEFIYTIQLKADVNETLSFMGKLRFLQSRVLFYQGVKPELALRFSAVDFNQNYGVA